MGVFEGTYRKKWRSSGIAGREGNPVRHPKPEEIEQSNKEWNGLDREPYEDTGIISGSDIRNNKQLVRKSSDDYAGIRRDFEKINRRSKSYSK